MTTEFRVRLLEFCLWVLTATAAIVSVLGVVSFLVGGGLLRLKFYLFVAGLLIFGIGSFGIQPERPSRDRKLVTVESESRSRIEEVISRIPPLKSRLIPMSDRISRDVKVLVTGIVLLMVSLTMEVVFDVTPT